MTDVSLFAFITVTRDGPVTTITLNRPQVLNALHPPMHAELQRAFDSFAADPAQKVAILTGAGRAFCAGTDLKYAAAAISEDRQNELGYPPSGYAGLTERHDLTKPLIAAVNGLALGGGFEIALACDIIIASEGACFALPEPLVGAVALGGGVHRLVRQTGLKQAMGILLSGRTVDAAEAQLLGLVNAIVPSPDMLEEARRWAAQILRASPAAIRATKQMALRGMAERDLATAIAAQSAYPAFQELLRSPDAREGVEAFAKKREPRWST